MFPTTAYKPLHLEGCVQSDKPEFIIQGKEGTARSIYFRHCGGAFRNAMMQVLDLNGVEGNTPTDTYNYPGQEKFIGPHQVLGLEWKKTTRLQNIMFVDSITYL